MGYSNLALTDVMESESPEQLRCTEGPEKVEDLSSISSHYRTEILNSAILTLIMDEFVLDESEKQDLMDCAEELIQGNGAEWVWHNRDMLLDLLEFQGYYRKSH